VGLGKRFRPSLRDAKWKGSWWYIFLGLLGEVAMEAAFLFSFSSHGWCDDLRDDLWVMPLV